MQSVPRSTTAVAHTLPGYVFTAVSCLCAFHDLCDLAHGAGMEAGQSEL